MGVYAVFLICRPLYSWCMHLERRKDNGYVDPCCMPLSKWVSRTWEVAICPITFPYGCLKFCYEEPPSCIYWCRRTRPRPEQDAAAPPATTRPSVINNATRRDDIEAAAAEARPAETASDEPKPPEMDVPPPYAR